MNSQTKEEFLSLCSDFDQALLVTLNAAGSPRARPMFVAKIDHEGDMWFVTDKESGKVDEIFANPNVCITMSGGGRHVSLSGTAQVVYDQQMVSDLWRESWRVWFPDGKSDQSIALIQVEPHEGEFWDNSGLRGLKYLFEAVTAYTAGRRPELPDTAHGKVDL